MTPLIDMLDGTSDPRIAIVGATDNPHKFGNRIYRNLQSKGYGLYPVNPVKDVVEGDPTFATLADLPEAPDIIDFVVPPTRTLRILEEARELGYMQVWIQPGAESADVVRYLDEHGFTYIVDDCIMVRSAHRPIE